MIYKYCDWQKLYVVIKTDKQREIILVSQQLHLITYDPISQFGTYQPCVKVALLAKACP